jgi:hypothetical protein
MKQKTKCVFAENDGLCHLVIPLENPKYKCSGTGHDAENCGDYQKMSSEKQFTQVDKEISDQSESNIYWSQCVN